MMCWLLFLDGMAKSGPQYARMFCQENKVFHKNCVGWDVLASQLKSEGDDIRAVVAVDDIIGTGRTASECLANLNEVVGDVLRSSGATLFLVAICGFQDDIAKVEAQAEQLGIRVRVICLDVLTDGDRAFSEASAAFESAADRESARELASARGEQLEKKWPLGHGDCQALVVFFANCPNNSLSILYKESSEWTALFPRRRAAVT